MSVTVSGIQNELCELLWENGIPARIENMQPLHYRWDGRFSEPGPGGPTDSEIASPSRYVNLTNSEQFDEAVEIVANAFGAPTERRLGYDTVQAITVGSEDYGVRIIILPPTRLTTARFGIVGARAGRRTSIAETHLRRIIKEEIAHLTRRNR